MSSFLSPKRQQSTHYCYCRSRALNGSGAISLLRATFVTDHSSKNCFFCFCFLIFGSFEIWRRMWTSGCKWRNALCTLVNGLSPLNSFSSSHWCKDKTSQRTEIFWVLTERFLWTSCCSQTIAAKQRNRKTRSAIPEIKEMGVGVRRGKKANIWKSFQLRRKEAKHRGHYFNFLQFSTLRDAQEILYANSLFLKSWKVFQN